MLIDMPIVFISVVYYETFVAGKVAGLECDRKNYLVDDGNIGIVSDFPWLGILKVLLHEIDNQNTAVTGIVLIKDQFAVANADDVTKIPKNILLQDTEVMFIVGDNYNQWFCKIKNITTHPEYNLLSYNTISIIELYSDDVFLAQPICWPTKNEYHTTKVMYVIGYTDENSIFEKTLREVQGIDRSICDHFYSSAQLPQEMLKPSLYRCARDVHATDNCLWDNGMAVASNASGHWVLMGLTILGPGCSLPARFIDMMSYLPWIYKTISSLHLKYKQNDPLEFARSNEVEIDDSKEPVNIPIHELFNKKLARRYERYFVEGRRFSQPQDPTYHIGHVDYYQNLPKVIEKPSVPFHIFLNTPAQFALFEFPRNACRSQLQLAYKEVTKLTEVYNPGVISGTYWVTVNDHNFEFLSCIKVTMKAFDFEPGTAMIHFNARVFPKVTIGKQPFLKKIKIPQKDFSNTTAGISNKNTTISNNTGDEFVSFLQPDLDRVLKMSIDLQIDFKINRRAELRVEVYGLKRNFVEKDKDIQTLLPPKLPDTNVIKLPKTSSDNTPLDEIDKFFWSMENTKEDTAVKAKKNESKTYLKTSDDIDLEDLNNLEDDEFDKDDDKSLNAESQLKEPSNKISENTTTVLENYAEGRFSIHSSKAMTFLMLIVTKIYLRSQYLLL